MWWQYIEIFKTILIMAYLRQLKTRSKNLMCRGIEKIVRIATLFYKINVQKNWKKNVRIAPIFYKLICRGIEKKCENCTSILHVLKSITSHIYCTLLLPKTSPTSVSWSTSPSGANIVWTINLCLLFSFGSYSNGCNITITTQDQHLRITQSTSYWNHSYSLTLRQCASPNYMYCFGS